MQKKSAGKKPEAGNKITIDLLAAMMNNSFKHLEDRLDEVEGKLSQTASTVQLREMESRLTDRLDKIEFRLTGQDQRISALEDRMRQVATKVGMEFTK